jgi:hypothetical protein
VKRRKTSPASSSPSVCSAGKRRQGDRRQTVGRQEENQGDGEFSVVLTGATVDSGVGRGATRFTGALT